MTLYITNILSEALLIHFMKRVIVNSAVIKLKVTPMIISLLKKNPFSI